ncbi:MAG: endonuclease domain-containing protein [Patescibacteria group bacterium]
MYKYLFNNKPLIDRRRELRKNQTDVEKKLWECLRGKRFCGLKFYRQFSIGPYILDFYCPKLRLGIELDGDKHMEGGAVLYDRDREKILQASNIKIIRFWNDEVENNVETVLEKIKK